MIVGHILQKNLASQTLSEFMKRKYFVDRLCNVKAV